MTNVKELPYPFSNLDQMSAGMKKGRIHVIGTPSSKDSLVTKTLLNSRIGAHALPIIGVGEHEQKTEYERVQQMLISGGRQHGKSRLMYEMINRTHEEIKAVEWFISTWVKRGFISPNIKFTKEELFNLVFNCDYWCGQAQYYMHTTKEEAKRQEQRARGDFFIVDDVENMYPAHMELNRNNRIYQKYGKSNN